MKMVSIEDSFVSILPFLVVIGIEFLSVVANWLPTKNRNVTVPKRAREWIQDYDTERRELLATDPLQKVLERELGWRYNIEYDDLESEARGIKISIQKQAPLSQNFFETLVEETTALAYDIGRFYFSILVTTVSLIAVIYTRVDELSLSLVPVSVIILGPVVVFTAGTIYWFRKNINSINDYAGFRDDHFLSPISAVIVFYNLISIIIVLSIDGCVGPLGVPNIPVQGACEMIY